MASEVKRCGACVTLGEWERALRAVRGEKDGNSAEIWHSHSGGCAKKENHLRYNAGARGFRERTRKKIAHEKQRHKEIAKEK